MAPLSQPSIFQTLTTATSPLLPKRQAPTPSPNSSSSSSSSSSGLAHYTFILIAAAIIILITALYLFLRKRRSLRLQSLHRTQQSAALSQDLATSTLHGGRGWSYGARGGRHWGDGGGILALAMRRGDVVGAVSVRGRGGGEEGGGRGIVQEGLDERGEAPPPYKRSGEIEVPGRTIGREMVGLKLPGYEEVVVGEVAGAAGSGTVGQSDR